MPFPSWCALRTDILRRDLDNAAQAYKRRMMVWEHEFGWWAGFRATAARVARDI